MRDGLKIEYIDIDKLTHYENNCKIHTKEPTLFNKKGIDFFYELLSLHGVDEVNFYSVHNPIDKHYGYFVIK